MFLVHFGWFYTKLKLCWWCMKLQNLYTSLDNQYFCYHWIPEIELFFKYMVMLNLRYICINVHVVAYFGGWRTIARGSTWIIYNIMLLPKFPVGITCIDRDGAVLLSSNSCMPHTRFQECETKIVSRPGSDPSDHIICWTLELDLFSRVNARNYAAVLLRRPKGELWLPFWEIYMPKSWPYVPCCVVYMKNWKPKTTFLFLFPDDSYSHIYPAILISLLQGGDTIILLLYQSQIENWVSNHENKGTTQNIWPG